MASTHEPDQLLEPSNLLEPLDLTDKAPIDGMYASASPDRPAISQNRLTRATSSAPRRTRAERRSPLKPALMIAGALACFGAGTAVPQLQALMPSRPSHWAILDTASVRSASVDQPAKSDELNSAKRQSTVQTSGPSSSGVAQPASGTRTPPASSAEQDVSTVAQAAQSESAPAQQVVGCVSPCNQQSCPKNDANCLEGDAVSPPQVSTKPDSSPAKTRESKTGEATVPLRDATISPGANAETRASGRQEDQSSRRNKRAAQRSTADRASVPRRTAGSVSQSGRDQDTRSASAWRREWGSDEQVPTANSFAGWPDREANRAAGGWGERNGDDYFSTTRSAERGVNRDTDQPANWRRDRYGEYPRNDDRRLRAARDGDFVAGRGERIEGPLMTFPPARMRW
jgi:hypothetical protein